MHSRYGGLLVFFVALVRSCFICASKWNLMLKAHPCFYHYTKCTVTKQNSSEHLYWRKSDRILVKGHVYLSKLWLPTFVKLVLRFYKHGELTSLWICLLLQMVSYWNLVKNGFVSLIKQVARSLCCNFLVVHEMCEP